MNCHQLNCIQKDSDSLSPLSFYHCLIVLFHANHSAAVSMSDDEVFRSEGQFTERESADLEVSS